MRERVIKREREGAREGWSEGEGEGEGEGVFETGAAGTRSRECKDANTGERERE